jgi:DNA-binding NarL/FixJ family response regulator
MEEPFSIEIAEDHTILREDLNALLSSQTDLKVVGEAGDGLVKG